MASAAASRSRALRAASTTRAPRRAASRAVASPTPLEAPATTITCSPIGLGIASPREQLWHVTTRSVRPAQGAFRLENGTGAALPGAQQTTIHGRGPVRADPWPRRKGLAPAVTQERTFWK